MGRASESTWVSSCPSLQTHIAQLPHRPSPGPRHMGLVLHMLNSQLPLGYLPATRSVPMLSAPAQGPRGWGPGQDVPEYLPPLLRLMKHRMSKMRSRTTMALMKPMNHSPRWQSQLQEAASPAWGGRRGRRLRPSPGLNAGPPGALQSQDLSSPCQSPAWASDLLRASGSICQPLCPANPACQGHPMSRTPIPEIRHEGPLSGTPRQGLHR